MTAPGALHLREEPAGGGRVVVHVTLANARHLNALTPEMFRRLRDLLPEWRRREEVACVALAGEGHRAFCAGGDLKRTRHYLATEGARPGGEMERFFLDEYRLIHDLHYFPRPVLAWCHGFTMGAGLGLAQAASHRVVTEATCMAMPEITLGLYPDCGASWFLNRAPGRTGLFAGLTGAHLGPGDALFLGLAHAFVPEAARGAVLAGLARLPWTGRTADDHEVLAGWLRAHRQPAPDSVVRAHFDFIQEITDAGSAPAVAENLLRAAHPAAWIQRAGHTLQAGNPVTAHVTFALHRQPARRSHSALVRQEAGLSWRFAEHGHFSEGVRALLLGKDHRPRWRPERLSEVTPAEVAAMFASPWPEATHPFRDLESVLATAGGAT